MKSLTAISVAGVTAWMTAFAVRAPARDGDPWWQRRLGEDILHQHVLPRALGTETFTASGSPWTPQEWLYSLLLAVTQDHRVGWIMPAVCGLAAGTALAGVALRCRHRGVSDLYTTAAVFVCMCAMLQSFGARPQVFGWAGLSVLLLLLECDGAAAWGSVPLTAIWANLHASVLLSPISAALFVVARLVQERRWSSEVARQMAIAAACLAAIFMTPLGAELPRYAVALSLSPIRASIAEWAATNTNSFAFLLGGLPLLMTLIAFARGMDARDRLLAAAFVPALFFAVRNVPVFALAVAPVAFAAVPAFRKNTTGNRSSNGPARFVAASVAAALAVTTFAAWRMAPALPAIPVSLADVLLRDARTQPRVFCEDFAWCSLFLSSGTPALVFMDGRADPYPAPVWQKYRDVIDGRGNWAAILGRYRVNAVMVRRDGALDSLLAGEPTLWFPLAADGQARLYVKLMVRQRSVNARATVPSASMEPWKT